MRPGGAARRAGRARPTCVPAAPVRVSRSATARPVRRRERLGEDRGLVEAAPPPAGRMKRDGYEGRRLARRRAAGAWQEVLRRVRDYQRRHRVRQRHRAAELQAAHELAGRALVGDRRPGRDAGELDRLPAAGAGASGGSRGRAARPPGGAAAAPAEGRGEEPGRARREDRLCGVTGGHAAATIPRVSGDNAAGHPHLQWLSDPAVLAPLALLAGIYVWRFRQARREAGGRGAGRASGGRLRRRDARPAGGAGLADRRPRRGLPVLGAHGPARAARRHRAACSCCWRSRA